MSMRIFRNENIENGSKFLFFEKEFLFKFSLVPLGMVSVLLPYLISLLHRVSFLNCTVGMGFCTFGYGFCTFAFSVLLPLLFVLLGMVFVLLLNDFVILLNDSVLLDGGTCGL